ncbi:MAG TPA: D-alanyl-D-alanine carboxypeptidase/D-alanyl-D-alanine-endopeptidase [Gemmatimonadales bacterium]|nr:D-alanyl-D-alanine carboxypeptidase/D-alanyl-D-alanine-endopeptidase [Gemmatimonadales bacterium]
MRGSSRLLTRTLNPHAMPLLLAGLVAAWSPVPVLSAQSLARRVEAVMARPEFAHAFFGVEFYDLAAKKPVYRLNGDKFFTPASTTKLLSVGTALELLGADYRFHTRVYRTGPIGPGGILEGDLVLVASGDPNLSGRARPDGTLAFKDEDHSYAGEAVDGDPLAVIRELAGQIAARGIRRVTGRVIVDATLFRGGDREGGTAVVISPIAVNDNVIDLLVTPGQKAGDPAAVTVAPATAYLRLTAHALTVPKDSAGSGDFTTDVANPDGSRTVVLSGTIPVGRATRVVPYAVPDPVRFAEFVFTEALHERGVAAAARQEGETIAFAGLAASYTDQNAVAEHVSLPLSEEAKVTLKVSQNLHASMMPRIVGAVVGKKSDAQAGFDLEREWLTRAGLDVSSASQGDGAGASAHYTPDFMVAYLAFMAGTKSFPAFFAGLPVLGKDGTLFNIQVASPAAGQVHGKTGTFGDGDLLNRGQMVTAKGLAGYFTRPDGRRFAFAVYINNVIVKHDADVRRIVGEAVGEIAAAGYLARP